MANFRSKLSPLKKSIKIYSAYVLPVRKPLLGMQFVRLCLLVIQTSMRPLDLALLIKDGTAPQPSCCEKWPGGVTGGLESGQDKGVVSDLTPR